MMFQVPQKIQKVNGKQLQNMILLKDYAGIYPEGMSIKDKTGIIIPAENQL